MLSATRARPPIRGLRLVGSRDFRRDYCRAGTILVGVVLGAPVMAQHCSISSSAIHFGSRTAQLAASPLSSPMSPQWRGAGWAAVRCDAIPYGFRVRACLRLYESIPDADRTSASVRTDYRTLASGSRRLRFELYRDNGLTERWGSDPMQLRALTVTRSASTAYASLYALVLSSRRSVSAGRYVGRVRGVMTYALYPAAVPEPDCQAIVSNPAHFSIPVFARVEDTCRLTVPDNTLPQWRMTRSRGPRNVGRATDARIVSLSCSKPQNYRLRIHSMTGRMDGPASRNGDLKCRSTARVLSPPVARSRGDGVVGQPVNTKPSEVYCDLPARIPARSRHGSAEAIVRVDF
jgi:hypothetical protein